MTDDLVNTERQRFLDWAPAVRSDAEVWAFGNESVAWSPDGAAPISLDGVGTLVFQVLDGSATVGELVGDVHAAIGLPEAVAEAQLRRIVAQLDSGALLTSSSPHLRPTGQIDVFPGPLNH